MAVRKKFTYSISPARKPPVTASSGMPVAAAGDAEAHFNRANALYGKAQYHEALADYDLALALAPQHVAALTNRGTTLARLDRFAEAVESYDRAVAIDPANVEVHYKRASTLRALNRFDDAIAAYSQVIALVPGHAVARNRRGSCLLLTGRYTEGWRDYEARWQEWRDKRAAETGPRKKLLDPDNFGKPLWDGSSAKITLLVWAEQGLGDQILFATMLREVAARVDKVILAIEERLHPLFSRSFPDFEIATFANAVKRGGYERQVPLGGLGRLLRNSADDFLRNRKAYLKADPQRVAQLRKTLNAGTSRLCGLSWLSKIEETGEMKSLSLAALAPLIKTPGLQFVDLQYGNTVAERAALKTEAGVEIAHLDAVDNLQDIDGLAALIAACDLVVTISNTTAHLAGALGKPVLLMLPHSQGRLWYWQASGHDTLWYPDVRLFRQPVTGDWNPVITEVITAIAAPATDNASTLRESLTLVQQGDYSAAGNKLQRLLETNPQHAEALQLLGGIALLRNQPAEAAELLKRAIAAQPDHAVAHSNLALALSGLQRHDEALAHYDRACAINPEFADAHANRGVTLNTLQRFEEAVASYDRAIAINPRHADAHSNRGVALNNLNRYAEAIASYTRALALNPDHANAHWNQCLVRLLTGDFAGGWAQWPWRWKKRAMAFTSEKDQPFWYGSPHRRGKTDLPHGVPCTFDPPFWDGTPNQDSLLVWPEQGVGEQVMYASMLNEARARTGKLTLILDQKLHALFQRSFPDCRIVTVETALAENNFDWQIPLGDLGRFLRPKTADFLKHRKAYLKADPLRTAAIHLEIAPQEQRICGLSWFSRNAEFGPQKNIALDMLRPLLATPDLRFVDLQYGDTTAARDTLRRETGVDITRVASVDNWGDVDGFAALVNACDVIVTISNTTAHIAGALGKNVILMLPYSHGRFWYWQTDRDDTLWYPGMKVLRQDAHGDWTPVVRRACEAVAIPGTTIL
jgi:tetratricopeptide (TPR) repeat protein